MDNSSIRSEGQKLIDEANREKVRIQEKKQAEIWTCQARHE